MASIRKAEEIRDKIITTAGISGRILVPDMNLLIERDQNGKNGISIFPVTVANIYYP